MFFFLTVYLLLHYYMYMLKEAGHHWHFLVFKVVEFITLFHSYLTRVLS